MPCVRDQSEALWTLYMNLTRSGQQNVPFYVWNLVSGVYSEADKAGEKEHLTQ